MSFDHDPPENFRSVLDDEEPASSDLAAELRRLGMRIVTWAPPSPADAEERIREYVDADTTGVSHDALLAVLMEDPFVLAAVQRDIAEELRFI